MYCIVRGTLRAEWCKQQIFHNSCYPPLILLFILFLIAETCDSNLLLFNAFYYKRLQSIGFRQNKTKQKQQKNRKKLGTLALKCYTQIEYAEMFFFFYLFFRYAAICLPPRAMPVMQRHTKDHNIEVCSAWFNFFAKLRNA